MRFFIFGLVVCWGLVACGTKGALYIPEQQYPQEANPQESKPNASANTSQDEALK